MFRLPDRKRGRWSESVYTVKSTHLPILDPHPHRHICRARVQIRTPPTGTPATSSSPLLAAQPLSSCQLLSSSSFFYTYYITEETIKYLP